MEVCSWANDRLRGFCRRGRLFCRAPAGRPQARARRPELSLASPLPPLPLPLPLPLLLPPLRLGNRLVTALARFSAR